MPEWLLTALVTAVVLTTTTTTITSTMVTPAAYAGPVYSLYSGQAPSLGPASAHPMRTATGSWLFSARINPMEVCPEVWTGPNGRHAEFGDHSLGLLRKVVQAPACASGQLPTVASGPSSMELKPSVELLPVLLDALHLRNVACTVVRAVRLANTGVVSISLVMTIVPELRQPESPSLLAWLWSPDQRNYALVLGSQPGFWHHQGCAVSRSWAAPSVVADRGSSTARGRGHRVSLCGTT